MDQGRLAELNEAFKPVYQKALKETCPTPICKGQGTLYVDSDPVKRELTIRPRIVCLGLMGKCGMAGVDCTFLDATVLQEVIDGLEG